MSSEDTPRTPRISDDIHSTPSGATVVDGPRGMAYMRLVMLRQSLRLQVRTGMVPSRGINPCKIAREEFGIRARRRDKVLAEFEGLWERLGPEGMVDLQLQRRQALVGDVQERVMRNPEVQ